MKDAPTPRQGAGPAGQRGSGRIQALFWINVALIVHGSLYPWRFVDIASREEAVRHFFEGPMWTGFGDVTGNILLFMPLGALGAIWWRSLWPRVGFVAAGVCLALVLQIAQAWIPSRDSALSDVVWNVVGLTAGIVMALGGLRLSRAGSATRPILRAGPFALLVLWCGLEWWPFVPTLDWQHVKDALKPLLLAPRWNPHSVAEVSVSVVVLAYTVHGVRHRTRWLVIAVLASALAKLVIVDASLSLSHLVGYGVGLAASWGVWTWPGEARHRVSVPAITCASLAVAWFSIDELRPFTLSAEASPFHAMPFQALLEGSMEANALALMWDLFWLGAVIVPAVELGAQPVAFAIVLGIWVALLETAQRWLPHRSADITPALFPLLWVLFLPARPGQVR